MIINEAKNMQVPLKKALTIITVLSSFLCFGKNSKGPTNVGINSAKEEEVQDQLDKIEDCYSNLSISDIEVPASRKEILSNISKAKNSLDNVFAECDEKGSNYFLDVSRNVIASLENRLSAEEAELVGENTIIDAYESALIKYSGFEEESEGENSFNLTWKKLWWGIYVPDQFVFKIDASTCRKILSYGTGFIVEGITALFMATRTPIVMAASLALFGAVTGNPVILAVVSAISVLSEHALVRFVVNFFVSVCLSELFDYIYSHFIKDGVSISFSWERQFAFGLQ